MPCKTHVKCPTNSKTDSLSKLYMLLKYGHPGDTALIATLPRTTDTSEPRPTPTLPQAVVPRRSEDQQVTTSMFSKSVSLL